MDLLSSIHRWFGYALVLIVLGAALVAFNRARAGREFEATPFAMTMVLVDIQVVIGLVQYVVQEWWEGDAMIAYVHPGLMLAALAVGHAMVGRSRKQQMVQDAYRTAGKGLVAVLVLIIAGIGVASAP